MNMTPQEYQNYVRRMQKKSPLGKDMALAFLIGGLICAAGQGILNGWLAAGTARGGRRCGHVDKPCVPLGAAHGAEPLQ